MLSRPGHIIIGDGALMKCDSAAQLLTDWLKDCTVKNYGSSLRALRLSKDICQDIFTVYLYIMYFQHLNVCIDYN